VIIPLTVKKSTAYKEIPFAFLAVAALFVMSNKRLFFGYPKNVLTMADGIIMLIFFIIFLVYLSGLIRNGMKSNKKGTETKHLSFFKLFLMIAGGLLALFLGGEFTVRGAVSIARQLGINNRCSRHLIA